jgi:hypothetical protein
MVSTIFVVMSKVMSENKPVACFYEFWKSLLRNSSVISFSYHWSIFFSVYSSLGSGINSKNKDVICGFSITTFSFRRGLLEGFLALVKIFTEASKNVYWNKQTFTIVTVISRKKYILINFFGFKNNTHLVKQSL